LKWEYRPAVVFSGRRNSHDHGNVDRNLGVD
jgi:hypothetical protein